MNLQDRFFRRLADLQIRHPIAILAVVAASCIPAGWAALHLELRTDWTELLPENKPSIKDLRRIQERFGVLGTYTVAIEGDDLPAMERFAEDLSARISTLPSGQVAYVDKDVKDEKAFFTAHRWLYADLADLEAARDSLKQRLADEKARAAFDLGLDAEAGAPGPEDGGLEALKAKYGEVVRRLDHYRDGYFVGEDGHLLAVFVRAGNASNNLVATARLEQAIGAMVRDLDPGRYHPSLKIIYAGDLLTARAEHDAVRQDLVVLSTLCFLLIVGSIYLFYFEVRAMLVLAIGVAVGTVWTMGLTWMHIGYLSTATGFLFSIVPGNGVNSGVILVARYLEELRNGRSTSDAVYECMRTTWSATLTAATAAALSYGALVLTDIRGFNQFGFIGAAGMLLCWAGIYVAVPAMLVITQGWLGRLGAAPSQRRGAYGRPFLWLAEHAPAATVVVGTVVALAGVGLGYRWFTGDPFEYNLRNLRNQRSRVSGVGLIQRRVDHIMESDRPGGDGMVVLADRQEQVPLLAAAFKRLATAPRAAEEKPPIGVIKSILDVVPAEQDKKIAVLGDIRTLAVQALPRLAPEKRAELEPWVPPEDLKPVTLDMVPPMLKRPFTERDGRVGLVFHVSHPEGVSVYDGRGLLRFAEAVRTVDLGDGEVVHSSGRPVIFADMMQGIVSDGPRLTLISFIAILVLVVVTFRNPLRAGLAVYALLVGMSWFVGLAALSGVKLNFLNFIAIPITFGIGVDYGVNTLRRYAEEGWSSSRAVLLETGGAVMLCSMTTIWGYFVLLWSDSGALRSFGKLAILGEFTCLFAGLVVLPGIATLLARRSARQP